MFTIARTATLKTILAGTMVLAVVAPAAASVVLPESGPIPVARPEVAETAAPLVIPHREVIRISTSEQAIPEGRRDVRIVGARFLPDAAEDIDLTNPEQQSAAVNYAEWLVMTAVSRIFETGEDVADAADGTVQVAAASVE